MSISQSSSWKKIRLFCLILIFWENFSICWVGFPYIQEIIFNLTKTNILLLFKCSYIVSLINLSFHISEFYRDWCSQFFCLIYRWFSDLWYIDFISQTKHWKSLFQWMDWLIIHYMRVILRFSLYIWVISSWFFLFSFFPYRFTQENISDISLIYSEQNQLESQDMFNLLESDWLLQQPLEIPARSFFIDPCFSWKSQKAFWRNTVSIKRMIRIKLKLREDCQFSLRAWK